MATIVWVVDLYIPPRPSFDEPTAHRYGPASGFWMMSRCGRVTRQTSPRLSNNRHLTITKIRHCHHHLKHQSKAGDGETGGFPPQPRSPVEEETASFCSERNGFCRSPVPPTAISANHHATAVCAILKRGCRNPEPAFGNGTARRPTIVARCYLSLSQRLSRT